MPKPGKRSPFDHHPPLDFFFRGHFAGFGDDFFEVNFQDGRDAEQGVQRGILDFLLDVADGLPRYARFLRQHVQGKAALGALLLGDRRPEPDQCS